MSLDAGTRLGAYEVVGKLGEGGMGEVYRARDTQLGRDAALKVLPEALAVDAERLARFEREARTLASLDHPNIARVYGLERSAAGPVLVMELVEGRTLEEIIEGWGLETSGVTEILPIAAQIAAALEAAHEAGIVHRDLKPANVKVRGDGTVKVLDFGLAKAMDPTSSLTSHAASLTASPTMTSPAMTLQGVILGTAAYMSPEQARGRPVDKRADIWAFGVVLYEMLSRQRLFARDTVSDTLAAVLTRQPDVNDLRPDVPAYLKQLLRRCLDPDPKTRLRDIGEARVALARGDEPAALPAVTASPPPRRAWVLWTLAGALVVLAAAGGGWFAGRGGSVDRPWARFTQLTDQTGEELWPAISPDGQSIAYTSRAAGSWDVYVQRIGGRNATVVAGDPTRDEMAPAFSPDGSALAFHESDADGGIFIVGATGESARRLTDFGFHPAWSPDGRQIAFCTEEVVDPHQRNGVSALWVVAATGGTPMKIFDSDAVQPVWSPSGQRLAFWSTDGGQRDIKTIPAGGGQAVHVLQDPPLDWSPVWAPDGRTLYFASDRGGTMNLWQIAIDQASGRILGAPKPVTGGVQAGGDEVSVSRDGSRLVFRANLSSVVPVSMPFDPASGRLGVPTALIRRNGALQIGGLSPDGRWLSLYSLGERQEDIFVSRADGSELRRLTDDRFRDRLPVWSPDGKELAFYSNRTGIYQIWAIKTDGSGLRQLTAGPTDLLYAVYAPAGDRMIAFELPGDAIFIDPAKSAADQRPVPLKAAVPEGRLLLLAWSPDGRRVAGTIMQPSGSPVGVAVYDVVAGTTMKVSDDLGAFGIGWLPDNRRLLIVDARNRLWLVNVDSKERRQLDVPPPYRLSSNTLAMSSDTRTLFASGVLAESDIWMVEREPR